jgi:soluble lytic murein transglycosylase
MQFMNILTLIGVAGLLGCCATDSLAAPNRGDDVLLEMRSAFSKNQSKRLTELLPGAHGHVLEPWAAYWELRARLESASADEISAFLQRYKGTYQEDRLRNDWLLLLGKNRDWSRFASEAPNFRMNDDHEVRCYTLAMEQTLAGVNLAAEVKSQWYRQKDAGVGCTLAAEKHFAARHLQPADIWLKARLAVEARQIRAAQLAVALVAPDAAGDFAELSSNPARFLARLPATSRAQTQELALLALIRLADSSPDGAATAMQDRWSKSLSGAQRIWAWGAIGKAAAQKLSDEAVSYFSQASSVGMSDEHLAWRVRATLRQGRWNDALAAIKAMGADAAAEPIWTYWQARALLRPGRNEAEQQQAHQLLQGIAGVRGFYEMLALEELGRPIAPPADPEPLTGAEKDQARANPGLKRALAAIALGLRPEGVREWNYSTNLHTDGGMNDRELLAAAELACHPGGVGPLHQHQRPHAPGDRSGAALPDAVQGRRGDRSREIGLDPAYVYGLIRQESRFILDARSSVGASGLMQLMPSTARWTARKIGLPFSAEQVTDRAVNLKLGTSYLKLVLDDFDGSQAMAAAAYNAGPSRPRRWREGATVEAAIWAENIPFNETRDYVKKVLSNATVYSAMGSDRPT